VQRQADKAHEAQPVADLILGLIIRQCVESLQHKDAEHQHGIIRGATTSAAIGALQGSFQISAEQLEVHQSLQPLQRITRRRQRTQPVLRIKETRLRNHRRFLARGLQRIMSSAAPL